MYHASRRRSGTLCAPYTWSAAYAASAEISCASFTEGSDGTRIMRVEVSRRLIFRHYDADSATEITTLGWRAIICMLPVDARPETAPLLVNIIIYYH